MIGMLSARSASSRNFVSVRLNASAAIATASTIAAFRGFVQTR